MEDKFTKIKVALQNTSFKQLDFSETAEEQNTEANQFR